MVFVFNDTSTGFGEFFKLVGPSPADEDLPHTFGEGKDGDDVERGIRGVLPQVRSEVDGTMNICMAQVDELEITTGLLDLSIRRASD